MKNNDFVSSLFFLFIGLVFVGGGLKMGLGPLNAPGPGFFPAVIGGVFSLLSGALFVTACRRKGGGQTESFWRQRGSWVKILLCLLALVFYMLFLDYLGYLLTTAVLLFFLTKAVGKKGWAASIFVAILVSLGSYLMFRKGLGVLLPGGWIHF